MTRRQRRQRMMQGPEHVSLRIDRVTLSDVSNHVGRRIADSLAASLERELASVKSLPGHSASHTTGSAIVRVRPATMPEDIGAALAQSVMERLAE